MVDKSTHDGDRIELFVPIMKNANGKYIAVLSDDSVDRDEEKLSKGCIEKLGTDKGYLAALLNHENDVMNLVAEWTNRGVTEVDGHTALIAEPKFYKSNPKAKIIKGMLDEGAKPGVSIGALVKSYDDVDGMRVYTELELVEASFVGVPSNRHGKAMAVAKSYNEQEEKMVDDKFTQKDLDLEVEKKVEETKTELQKTIDTKEAEIAKLTKDAEEAKEATEEAVKEAETAADEAKVEAEKKMKEAEIEKKKALDKQKFNNEGGDLPEDLEKVDKAWKDGKIPIMNV